MKKYILNKIIILVLLLSTVSCGLYTSSVKLYSGEDLPSSEVAKISSWKESRYSPLGALIVHPMIIDGKNINPKRGNGEMFVYSILPGEHKIKTIIFWNAGTEKVQIKDPTEMVFSAKAGHVYLTKAYAPNEISEKVVIYFWLEDDKTGEVVAGTRPNKKK